ncbi:BTB/POZ domain-containing protein At5g47800 isoform X2 [Hevea brasiliensis]|uniref:BTB/POZ domain-containing protein At5g47800 isoform X2 n=1 Tax=Hevea brasiliensis TaxID=3981 RepID=UPI0025FFEF68|nr:BTB/POZ domain-containing protein At5g47800 isoform X2 [Hevea brasiliensis]
MKFMKLGTRPDTFYTEEATRSVISDVPSDFVVHINNISYLLHKFPLLPKCGLLQRLCSDSDDSSTVSIELHDLPGGEEAFELCAKYCYGITIDLSAHNFVPAFCAAKFLRMTESIEKGNFVLKLEYFFNSCILEGWKDSITTLQTTAKLTEWSENLGIIRKCIDSIAQKILTAPEKVTWSYTYTRPGYKKTRESIPRDWWTEDISDLDIDLFRFIITAIRSTYMLPPQLIGEALHVYACRWLPDTKRIKPHESSVSQNDDDVTEKNRRILESIVSMIPEDRGSVSAGFLLRLLGIANYLGASPVLKTELIRKSSLQIEEATVSDLVFPSQSSSSQHLYDTDLVLSVVESFLILWRRQPPETVENTRLIRAIRKVGKLIDTYLQVVSRDKNMPVSKVVSLAEALPDIARKDHDDLYKAINIYLKEHPDLGKEDKKRLCRSLDCQKLSREVRAHAVKNERLPLRTVVQVLFFEQEKGSRATDSRMLPRELFSRGKQMQISGEELNKLHLGGDEQSVRMEEMRRTPMPNLNKLHLGGDEQSVRLEEMRRTAMPESSTRDFPKNKRPDKNSQLESEIEEVESKWEKDAREEGISGSKLDPKKILQSRIRLDHGPDKVRDR